MRDARARDERVRRAELAGTLEEAQRLAADLEGATDRVARARAAIAAATATRDAMLVEGAPVAAVARHDRYLRRLRRDLDDARGELVRADARHRGQLDAVDDARRRLTLARAEREVIERHFAAWRAERRKLAERRDD
jgi:hypothetical protein